MFPRLPARNICCGHKFCVRDTKYVSDFVQKHFVSATNVSRFPQPKKHHGQQCVRNNVSSFTRALSRMHLIGGKKILFCYVRTHCVGSKHNKRLLKFIFVISERCVGFSFRFKVCVNSDKEFSIFTQYQWVYCAVQILNIAKNKTMIISASHRKIAF